MAPDRRYHTHRHLQEGIDLLQHLSAGSPWPARVALAWFMHDVVYDPQRHDNEEQSALLSHEALLEAGLPPREVQAIDKLILVTRHAAVPICDAEKLLVDIDLSILGAPAARYNEYTRQVREEYSHVPDVVFYPARLKVMEGFVGIDGQKALFHTAAGVAAFDAHARLNIANEINHLRSLIA